MSHRKYKIKFLLVQLLSIIPFLLFIFYLFDLWFDTRRELVLKENLTQSKLISSFTQNAFTSIINAATVLSNNPDLYTYAQKNNPKANQIINDLNNQADIIDGIAIWDDNGDLILDTSLEKSDVSITDRQYYKEMLNQKKAVLSEPVISRIDGKNKVIAAA
ncbi:MAG: hypothetical protein R3321_12670, partial [Nitrososphaeraceae archaeon]|nr:hypothetical protein [Nitrososphaeraceae archaeon]